MALPTNANVGHPVGEPVKPEVPSASFTTPKMVAFSSPQEQEMRFVHAYIRENDESLLAIKQRSKRPFRIIESVLQRYGLPVELKYLAVIESDLKTTAVSRVGAKGPWQLMASTAQDLGLKVDSTADERTNIYKSTKAAALYLRDLHNTFKDWLLVLAAYNAGPLPVFRAMHRAGSNDFRQLERYLPAETRQHVRRFLATTYYFDQLAASERQVARRGQVVRQAPVTRQNADPRMVTRRAGGAVVRGNDAAVVTGVTAQVSRVSVPITEVAAQVNSGGFPRHAVLLGVLQRRRDSLNQSMLS